jgi:predicted  nucleic acid-binding Zn-ribbon protein
MSSDIESLISDISDIIEQYENFDSSLTDVMGLHTISQQLHSKLTKLSQRLIEIDKLATDYERQWTINVRRERERLLDNEIYTAVNRAQSSAEAKYIETKGEMIEYQRLYERLRQFARAASETGQDIRSFISSLRKEREYDQFTNQ